MKQSNFSHHLLSVYSAQQHCIWPSDCPQDPVLRSGLTRPDGPRHDSSPTVDALNQELNQIVFEVEILPQGLPSQHQVHLQSLKISTHSSYIKQMEHKVLTHLFLQFPSVFQRQDQCLINIPWNTPQSLNKGYYFIWQFISIFTETVSCDSMQLIAAVPVSYGSGSLCFCSMNWS